MRAYGGGRGSPMLASLFVGTKICGINRPTCTKVFTRTKGHSVVAPTVDCKIIRL